MVAVDRPERQVRVNPGAQIGLAFNTEGSAHAFHSFTHASQSEMLAACRSAGPVKTRPVIRDFDAQSVRLARDLDLLPDTVGVPVGIGQCLLNEAIDRDLER
jgi:hypothetical protein